MNDFKFAGKYLIKADLRCITGLHIGGTDEGFEIGGIDNPVIKDPITGYPYIPGSSIKGKIRSLLEWTTECKESKTCAELQIEKVDSKKKELMEKINQTSDKQMKEKLKNELKTMKASIKPCDCGTCDICIIFGCSADTEAKEPTRITIRDSFPKGLFGDDCKRRDEDQITDGTIAEWRKNLGEKVYTEVKTENTIDRLTSDANPRSLERVPADSIFEVEIVFDLYNNADTQRLKKVFEGMALLEDSSLGGGGSRGSGKVVFENFKINRRDLSYYTEEKDEVSVNIGDKLKRARDIYKNFSTIFNEQGNEANKVQQSQ